MLPERIATGAESRQRFEREARAISQIGHPHICALYDVGSGIIDCHDHSGEAQSRA